MLINENIKVFDNILNLRRLLTESVSKSIIVDAINNKEYLYLYYAGDELTSTGYRIIKPFIIGVNGHGNEVLRAWQIDGDSDSFKGKLHKWKRFHKGVRRVNHEFHPNADVRDVKGKPRKKDIPGWRLFRTDQIKSVYPTGNTFKTEPLPPNYRGANEKRGEGNLKFNIVSVHAAIPSSYKPKPEEDITTTADKYLKSTNIRNYIEKWYNTVKRIKKRSPSKIVVYVNKEGYPDFSIGYGAINKENVPEERIIGNLQDLYNEYVLPNLAKTDNWLKEKRKDAIKQRKK